MTITTLDFKASAELAKEMEFFAATQDGLKIYADIHSQGDVVRYIESNPDYVDLKAVVAELPKGRWMDVGVGWGMSSAYLAIKGIDVVSVEPSLDSCRRMEEFFARIGISNTLVRGTAESMNQLPAASCDGVVFWSSLHHCDDPVQALKNAHHVVRPGGFVVLYEPVLRFYRRKAWFYRMMVENPQKVGHYGGNEHIYRTHEYLEFLAQAGFSLSKIVPSLKYDLGPKRASWDNAARWWLKKLYYRGTRAVALSDNLLSHALMHASLLTPLIIGVKRAS